MKASRGLDEGIDPTRRDFAGRCRLHPEAASVAHCEKHDHGYCAQCLESNPRCTDPNIYCRHRTACLIWELARRRKIEERRQSEIQDPP